MPLSFLDFEQPIAELEAKIDELRFVATDDEVNVGEEIARLRAKSRALTTSIFANLTPWQVAQLARHPQRPYTLDYAAAICDEFHELHGDRMYADDHAIVGGLARLDGRPVMLIGHQKGRDTKERVRRNYGMPKPEGYRKALRLMKLAERFRLPLVTLIDTPGAYPGVGSEERNQSEAIARNLFEMSTLRVPGDLGGDRRGRLRRRAGDRRVRPADHAAVRRVLGDLARGLRLHPVEERRQEGTRGGGDGHHRRAPRQARARRRDRQGAARRRASRPAGDGRRPQGGDPAPPARGRAVARGAVARRSGTRGCARRACTAPRDPVRGRSRRSDCARRCASMLGAGGCRADRLLRRAERRPRLDACCSRPSPGSPRSRPLRAMHVDHGLHPDAARWSAHSAALAARCGVPCEVVRVDARPRRGREPRGRGAGRALRGAGGAAAAGRGAAHRAPRRRPARDRAAAVAARRRPARRWPACAPVAPFASGWHARPLLGFTRAELREWAEGSASSGSRTRRMPTRASIAITCGSRCCRRCARAGRPRRAPSGGWPRRRPRRSTLEADARRRRPRRDHRGRHVARSRASCTCRRAAAAGCCAPGCAARGLAAAAGGDARVAAARHARGRRRTAFPRRAGPGRVVRRYRGRLHAAPQSGRRAPWQRGDVVAGGASVRSRRARPARAAPSERAAA